MAKFSTDGGDVVFHVECGTGAMYLLWVRRIASLLVLTGKYNRVGWAYEWFSGDEGVLSRNKDGPEVAVLSPTTVNLNRRQVCG